MSDIENPSLSAFTLYVGNASRQTLVEWICVAAIKTASHQPGKMRAG